MRTPSLSQSLSLTLILATLSIFASSCGAGDSQVRVVDAIPDSPINYDVVVNGTTVTTDVGFESISPTSGYESVPAGSVTIEMFQTGTTTPVNIDTSFKLGGGKQYTVVATGLSADTSGSDAPTAVLLTDNNTAPTTGNVNFRIVHASPSAPASVDVYIVPTGTDISSASPTISGLNFQQASGYQSISAATYAYVLDTVLVTPSGSKTPFVNQNYTLTAGQVRTLVLVDATGGGAPAPTPLELFDLH